MRCEAGGAKSKPSPRSKVAWAARGRKEKRKNKDRSKAWRQRKSFLARLKCRVKRAEDAQARRVAKAEAAKAPRSTKPQQGAPRLTKAVRALKEQRKGQLATVTHPRKPGCRNLDRVEQGVVKAMAKPKAVGAPRHKYHTMSCRTRTPSASRVCRQRFGRFTLATWDSRCSVGLPTARLQRALARV